jgi:hypothetical protein
MPTNNINNSVTYNTLGFLSDVLLLRHALIENPWSPDHINRLIRDQRGYNALKYMREHNPAALYTTRYVCIDLDATATGMQQDEIKKILEKSIFGRRVPNVMCISTCDENGSSRGCPARLTDEHTRIYGSSSRSTVARWVDTDAPSYRAFRQWAAMHQKTAVQNILIYDAFSSLLGRKCSTWPQMKRLWPEMMVMLDEGRKKNGYISKYLPAPNEISIKGSRKQSKYFVEAFRNMVEPLNPVLTQALLAFRGLEGQSDDRLAEVRKALQTRPVYNLFAGDMCMNLMSRNKFDLDYQRAHIFDCGHLLRA